MISRATLVARELATVAAREGAAVLDFTIFLRQK